MPENPNHQNSNKTMSEGVRNLLTILMLMLLSISAFVAGYFTNDFIEERRGAPFAGVGERSEFGVFWEAWERVEGNFLGDLPSSQQVTYGAIRGAIGLLNDPYTIFIEPVVREQERESLQGTFGGIGANLTRIETGEVVLEPIPGNPAEAAGIRSGDILLEVDGIQILPDLTINAIIDLVKGEKGTTVELLVLHEGESDPELIAVERADILIPSVAYRLLREDEAIGYIQLTRFSDQSTSEISEAINALVAEGAEMLVLDLRGNGGGLLDAAVSISDLFINEGPLLYQQRVGQDEQTYNASDETLAPEIPLAVLIDGGTASASEILAGALQDRDRAVLVGHRTFGKGSVQLIFDLSDGSSVHVTSSRWFTPDRTPIDQQGLEPDINVEVTQDDIDNGRDAMLLAAVDFLQREQIGK